VVQLNRGLGKVIATVNEPTALAPAPPDPLKVNVPPVAGMPDANWAK
jgi:hypothetical protein